MRISVWSSDVCSSDLEHRTHPARHRGRRIRYDAVAGWRSTDPPQPSPRRSLGERQDRARSAGHLTGSALHLPVSQKWGPQCTDWRSEEHTSELQSLMRISYAVFCLTKNTEIIQQNK